MTSDEIKYLISVGIYKKYHEKTLDEYDNDKETLAKVQNYLKNLKEFKKEGIGMFLWGSNGVGKSHLMNCVFKELILKHRQRARIIHFTDLITTFTSGWYEREGRTMLREIKNADFLGIEEINKEYRNKSKENDLPRTVLDSVLRYRVQMNKPTWFTSNTKASEIALDYSVDIASMLKESAIILNVVGDDYRDKIRDKIKRKL